MANFHSVAIFLLATGLCIQTTPPQQALAAEPLDQAEAFPAFDSLADLSWYVQQVAPPATLSYLRETGIVKVLNHEGRPVLIYDRAVEQFQASINVAWPAGDLRPTHEHWARFPVADIKRDQFGGHRLRRMDATLYEGRLAVAYQDYVGDRPVLRFAWAMCDWPTAPEHWQVALVDHIGEPGYQIELDVFNDRPLMVYTAEGLRTARAESPCPTQPEYWSVQDLSDSHGGKAVSGWLPSLYSQDYYCAIGFASNEGISIAFLDARGDHGRIMGITGCGTEAVADTTGFSALAMSLIGNYPCFCYVDDVGGSIDLHYIAPHLDEFDESNPDSLPFKSHAVSERANTNSYPLLVELQGRPLIAFYRRTNSSNSELMLYWASGADPASADDWETLLIDYSGGLDAGPTDIAVIDGLPYLAYTASDGSVRLAIPVIRE